MIEEQWCEARRNSSVAKGDQQRTFRDFVTLEVLGFVSSIAHLAVDENNFEVKSALISIVQQSQFRGTSLEDPKRGRGCTICRLDA